MERKRIYLCLAHMSEAGLEQKYIQEAFDTNWVVPLGPNVNGFEKDLEEFVNSKFKIQDSKLDKRVVALSAGTAAVHLGLIACGVGPGDEVIVQSFTFCASSHPITYLGAKPIFVDSEKDSWNIDPVLMEEAIKDRMECLTTSTVLWKLPTNMVYLSSKMLLRVLAAVGKDKFWVPSVNTVCSLSMAIR